MSGIPGLRAEVRAPATDRSRCTERAERRMHALFLAPSALLILGLLAFPFLSVLLVSLQNRNTLDPQGTWTGLLNYSRVFADPYFWQALMADVIWTLGTVLLSAAAGLVIALVLNERFPGRSVVRALVLIPYMVPTIVAVLVFRYMMNDLYGVINYTLRLVGLPGQTWLASTRTAMLAVILVGTWKFFPFFIIALLGRLQLIPLEQYEAARVDGATYFQCFRYVTWPSVLPIFLLTLLLRVIWTFNKFDLVYMMTQGGPLGSTNILPILVYSKAFGEYDLGYSSAVAVVMVALLVMVSTVYFVLQGKVKRIYG